MSLIMDSNGQTLLHWSVANNDLDSSLKLMEKMSVKEISLSNFDNKYTALHLAAQNGSVEIINLLLERGQRALACKVDRYGQTALHWCSSNPEHFASAKSLMQIMECEDLCIQNTSNQYTALHVAVQANNVDLVELMTAKSKSPLVCKIDQHGQTALHWAAIRGNYRACQIFCKYMNRLHINRMSNDHKTASDLAIAGGYHDIAVLLKSIPM